MRDLHNNIKFIQTVDPVVASSDTNGATVDRQGFESVEHIVFVGESGDTLSGSVYLELVLQHSDDDSTWSDVTSAADVLVNADSGVSAPNSSGVFRTIDAAAEDDAKYRIGYVGGKRYSRVQLDFTGTHTNGIPVCVAAALGHAEQAPVSD